jgi:hypothetical protein
MIADHIISLDDKFGRASPPRSPESTSRTRLITDDPRWEARWSFEYQKDSTGDLWDLLELFVYGEQRMTAAVRGDQVIPRFFLPGSWERIFIGIDPGDTARLLPN